MISININNEQTDNAISILFAGDLYPGGRSESAFLEADVGSLCPDLLPYFAQSDLSLVNLECPLTTCQNAIVKSGPNLAAHPDVANGLKAIGFDVAVLANNHILDMGEGGFQDTINALESRGIMTVGAGQDLNAAKKPLFVQLKDISVAVIAMAEHEFSIATRKSAGANPLSLSEGYYQIQCAAKEADFVLVSLHGGNEYYSLPGPAMVKTCRFLIDVGANAVICHHAHFPSGFEVYRGAPIIYGTGNFIFDWQTPRPLQWYFGYLVELKIRPKKAMSVNLIPYLQSPGTPKIRLMSVPEQEDFRSIMEGLNSIIGSEDCLERAWEGFCRSRREEYLSYVLTLSPVERRLLKKGVWPVWRIKKLRLPGLINLLTCESHRNALIDILSEESL